MKTLLNSLSTLVVSLILAGQTDTAQSAVSPGGQVIAWGDNSSGQTNIPKDLGNVVAVSAGQSHSMALKPDGTVVAWGANNYGQTNVPATVTNVAAIDAGNYHNMALKADGTVAAWGYNVHGESIVPAGLTGVVAIAAGGSFSLALKGDGTVAAWGGDTYGEVSGAAALANVVAIVAGSEHGLALKTDRTVVAWGINNYGQRDVPPGLTNVVAVAAGAAHSLALRDDGTVVAWGWNDNGESTVPAGLTNGAGIGGGYAHSLALRQDGTVLAWGATSKGQLMVPAGLTNVVGITAGGWHNMALVQSAAAPSSSYDVSRDFSIAANPNGAWSYGWKSNLTGGFSLLGNTQTATYGNGVPIEVRNFAPNQMPEVTHNATTNTGIGNAGQEVNPPGTVIFYPGADGSPQNFGVIRLTVPNQGGGIYGLESAVRSFLDGDRSGDTDYHVVVNGVEVFGEFLPPRSASGYSTSLSLAAGDTVDFMVGRGADGLLNGSGLKIQATLAHQTCSPHKATATATLVNGFVVGASITDPGCGYTNAPVVLFQGGGGTGAAATAVVSNGVVVDIHITNAGNGYTSTPDIAIASPPFKATLSIGVSKVRVTQTVMLGQKYVLESSSDMVTWTPTGPAFTAEAETIVSEFDVAVTGRFFRIREVP